MLWPGRARQQLASPMRIGLVCPTSPFPAKCGVGDYTRVLAQSLAKQGHQVWLLAAAPLEGSPDDVRSWIVTDWEYGLPAQVETFVKNVHPQVIHTQYQASLYHYKYFIHLVPAYLRTAGVGTKIVTTFHDLGAPPGYPVMNRLLAGCSQTAIVSNQPDFKELAVLVQGMPCRPEIFEIPIPASFSPVPGRARATWRAELGIKPDTTVVAYFGFLRQDKGPELLLQAGHALLQEGCKLQLLLIGAQDPSNPYHVHIRQYLTDMGLTGHVIWTGLVEPERASAFLQTADICVLPFLGGATLARSSLTTVLAHAVPTITYARDLPAFLRHQENIILLPQNTVAELVSTLRWVISSPGLQQALRRNLARIADHFRPEAVAGEIAKIYQQLTIGQE